MAIYECGIFPLPHPRKPTQRRNIISLIRLRIVLQLRFDSYLMEGVVLRRIQPTPVLVESARRLLRSPFKRDRFLPVRQLFSVLRQRRFKSLPGGLSVNRVHQGHRVLVIPFLVILNFCLLWVTFWIELLLRLNMLSDTWSFLHYRWYAFNTILVEVGRSKSPFFFRPQISYAFFHRLLRHFCTLCRLLNHLWLGNLRIKDRVLSRKGISYMRLVTREQMDSGSIPTVQRLHTECQRGRLQVVFDLS